MARYVWFIAFVAREDLTFRRLLVGYRANTLPSIYDGLVFDKNTTLTQKEVKRVAQVLDKLADDSTLSVACNGTGDLFTRCI